METNNKAVRDGSMDMLKFCLAMAVILFHGTKIYRGDASTLFRQGASAVEGFFIISGYYMAKAGIERKRESLDFIKSRIAGIFPHHIFAFVIAFFVTAYLQGLFSPLDAGHMKSLVMLGIGAVPEFLILPPIGGIAYSQAAIINMEWYLGALFLGMALIYPFILKYGDKFCSYAAPLIFMFCSGWLYQNVGTYRVTWSFGQFVSRSLVRSVAMLCMGVFVYWLSTHTREIKSQGYKVLFTIISAGCWYASFKFFDSHLPKDRIFAIVYLMGIGVLLEAKKGTYFSGLFNNKVSTFLGKISFPMYLNQNWVRRLMIRAKLSWSYPKCMLVFLGVTLIFSLLSLLLAHLYKKYRAKKREATSATTQ